MNQPPLLPFRRPNLRRWLLALAALALLFLAGLTAILVVWSRDEAPPDVRDLTDSPLELADDENGYALLVRASRLLPPGDDTVAHPTVEELITAEPWDAAVVTEALAPLASGEIDNYVDQALAAKASQATWISSPSDPMDCIRPIRDLAALLRLRALALAHEGRPDDALVATLEIIRIGHLVEHSRGNLIQHLTGLNIQQASMDLMRRIVEMEPALPRTLKTTAALLVSTPPPTDPLVHAIKSELRFFEGALVEIGSHGLGEIVTTEEDAPWIIKHAHRLPFSLKLNQTRRLHAENLRTAITAIDGDLEAARAVTITIQERLPKPGRRSPINFIGTTILSICTPTWEKVLITNLRHQSRLSATRAFLAVRAYQLDHGELPTTLDALVPDYLPAVPRDYFDGDPIRYSRDHRAIWSVGENDLHEVDASTVPDRRDILIRLPAD